MSIAIIRVCDSVIPVCDSVCLSVRKIKPKRLKLAHQLILGQKVKVQVKGQGHRVTKCKKAIEWPA